MDDILKVAMVQTDIVWEQPDKNLTKFSKIIESLTNRVGLIAFPEMFTTGFSGQPEKLAETMEGNSVTWMKKTASTTGAFVAGSLIIRENSEFYNRFILAAPDATIQYYDKRHLFNIYGTELEFSDGKNRKILKIGEWNICPQICYDLRFPVWYRNRGDYDILINVANWPEARHENWITLLKARAIENMAYCIGVNRIGKDDNNISYIGESLAVNSKGEILNKIEPGFNGILYAELSKTELYHHRKNFPVLQDADKFHLE